MNDGRGDDAGRCAAGRAVMVAATAAVITVLVVSVGAPPEAGAPAGAANGAASSSSGMALDRARLSRWCQDVLATPDAEAVVAHRAWRCVGRAGGIWRRQPILEPELCRHFGYRGESTVATEDAIVCLA